MNAITPTGARPAPGGTLEPFRRRAFTVLWIATLLGSIGTFMRDIASQWIVTGLSAQPTAVALIQAAAVMPVFLLAIPAGVLSDIFDKRRLLIGTQIALLAVTAALGVIVALDAMTVSALALLTFLGGIFAALSMPAWQAIVPDLVPRDELKDAVALNSLGFNVARAVGPALGGVVLAVAGATVTYGFDVVSYLVVIGALVWWRRPLRAADDIGEHFGGALRAGVRYAAASGDMHRLLWRTALVLAFGSAVWALLPLVAREELHGGPAFYGLLLASIGVGAVAAAFVMPRVRDRVGQDGLVLGATLLLAAAVAALALTGSQALAIAATFALGAAWIATVVTLNSAIQTILPDWVRGRGLAIYLTVFNGALAGGSLAWGVVAEAIGIAPTLLASAVSLALVAPATYRARLPRGDRDLTPSHHWHEPETVQPVADDRGPVTVIVAYTVSAKNRPAFLAVATHLGEARRRSGASAWTVAEDTAAPERILEIFVIPTWAEHRRQHNRVSHADADLQAAAERLHEGEHPPAVTHLVSLRMHGPAFR